MWWGGGGGGEGGRGGGEVSVVVGRLVIDMCEDIHSWPRMKMMMSYTFCLCTVGRSGRCTYVLLSLR